MTNSRRDFVRGSLPTAIAGSLWGGAAAQSAAAQSPAKAPAPEPMRVSCLSYSFRGLLTAGMMDIFGYMETCKYRYRLNAADLWASADLRSGFITSTEDDYLKKVRDGLDERELIVPNIAVDAAQVWDDDPDKREEYHRRALAFLNVARIIGARFVRIDAGAGKDRSAREFTNQQFDHVVKRYKEYAQYAHDHGFRAGAESHWGPEGYWPTMQKLFKAVDHPAFAFCCHINGWQGTQEEKDAADVESAPLVAHTHIAWNITEGPLVEKMNNLRKVNYLGYYSVEHHSAKDEYAEVGIQIAKVRAVLQSWRAGGDGGSSNSSQRPPRRAVAPKP